MLANNAQDTSQTAVAMTVEAHWLIVSASTTAKPAGATIYETSALSGFAAAAHYGDICTLQNQRRFYLIATSAETLKTCNTANTGWRKPLALH
ncbi:hypothetical protein GS610_11575 [Ruegeria sp. HKCCD6228]|uniref:hypothetical protein n=1 Tax=unclassified Ruegeria TaxID=2625375 RepID=UPI00148913B6|nr:MULTISPECIES: hypothetical protein [unclassified Ruegeria]NOD97847.1 hypothetical protein [Ruegeria sp. HKCCD6228]